MESAEFTDKKARVKFLEAREQALKYNRDKMYDKMHDLNIKRYPENSNRYRAFSKKFTYFIEEINKIQDEITRLSKWNSRT